MLIALKRAVAAAGDHSREVERAVHVAVAQRRAEQHDRAIEQRAVAVLGLRQLLDEFGERRDVVGVDLRQLFPLLGIPAVV